jgi:D-alanyl-D-alanine carboxypeptidase (penicillin-binding protein 5/6)
MARLGRALLTDHPEATDYTSVKEFTFHKIHQNNWNALLFHDSRVNGIKTGHVAEAGYHLVASAKSGDLAVISALIGAPSEEKRRDDSEKLIDWALRTFVNFKPDLSKIVPAAIPVSGGTAENVGIGPASAVSFTLARGEEKRVAAAWLPAVKFVEAPVAKGAKVGEVSVTIDGKPAAAVPIVAQAAVARAGFFKRMGDKLRRAL